VSYDGNLLVRLRTLDASYCAIETMNEAANEIERLRAEVEKRKADYQALLDLAEVSGRLVEKLGAALVAKEVDWIKGQIEAAEAAGGSK